MDKIDEGLVGALSFEDRFEIGMTEFFEGDGSAEILLVHVEAGPEMNTARPQRWYVAIGATGKALFTYGEARTVAKQVGRILIERAGASESHVLLLMEEIWSSGREAKRRTDEQLRPSDLDPDLIKAEQPIEAGRGVITDVGSGSPAGPIGKA